MLDTPLPCEVTLALAGAAVVLDVTVQQAELGLNLLTAGLFRGRGRTGPFVFRDLCFEARGAGLGAQVGFGEVRLVWGTERAVG